MASIEEVLLNRVKVIGDGEWTLLGTPDDVIKELQRLIVEAKRNEAKAAEKLVYDYSRKDDNIELLRAGRDLVERVAVLTKELEK